jgi:hypothetical protein
VEDSRFVFFVLSEQGGGQLVLFGPQKVPGSDIKVVANAEVVQAQTFMKLLEMANME